MVQYVLSLFAVLEELQSFKSPMFRTMGSWSRLEQSINRQDPRLAVLMLTCTAEPACLLVSALGGPKKGLEGFPAGEKWDLINLSCALSLRPPGQHSGAPGRGEHAGEEG